jgi:hypothetical protein
MVHPLRGIIAGACMLISMLHTPALTQASTALIAPDDQQSVDVLAVLKQDRALTISTPAAPACANCVEINTTSTADGAKIRGTVVKSKPRIETAPSSAGPLLGGHALVSFADGRKLLFVFVAVDTRGTNAFLIYDAKSPGSGSLLRIKTTQGGYKTAKNGDILFDEAINPKLPGSFDAPCPTEGKRELTYSIVKTALTQTRVLTLPAEKSAWCGVEGFYRAMLSGPNEGAYQRLSRKHQETRPYKSWFETYAATRVGFERLLSANGDTFTVLASETGADRITLFYAVTWLSEWDTEAGLWRITLLKFEPAEF